MPVGWIDTNGNGVYDFGDEIVIIKDDGNSGGEPPADTGWALAALAGGSYSGWESGVVTYESFSALAEAGIIGAEYGALAGPVGIAAGAVIGVATAYVIYNYHDEILNGWHDVV